MKQVKFIEGIPTCECGSQEFSVTFRELVSRELDASLGNEGWGEANFLGGGADPIEGVLCRGCDADIEVTPELERFIREIGG